MKRPFDEIELKRLADMRKQQIAKHHYVNLKTRNIPQNEKLPVWPIIAKKLFIAAFDAAIVGLVLFAIFQILKIWWLR
jgi:hypothetical protein